MSRWRVTDERLEEFAQIRVRSVSVDGEVAISPNHVTAAFLDLRDARKALATYEEVMPHDSEPRRNPTQARGDVTAPEGPPPDCAAAAWDAIAGDTPPKEPA